MAFANVIKSLRRNADMTQEELAEALGITSQAVSRWETGTATPDVPTVLKLAYLFEVSADTLLEVDHDRKKKEIHRLILETDNMDPEEAADALRNALSEYPRNETLMHALSRYLYYRVYNRNPGGKNAEKILHEAIRLTEYLYTLNRSEHIHTLLGMYRDAGMIEKGKELLKDAPGYNMVRQELAIELADGEEKIRLMQENAYILLTKLNWQVYMLSLEEEAFPEEERISMLRQMFEANRTLMPSDPEYAYNWQASHVPWQLAQHYSELGQVDEAIRWLEIMRRACDRDFDAPYSLKSPVFHGLEHKRNGRWDEHWMLSLMDNPYFDNVRADSRFAQIKADLEAAVTE